MDINKINDEINNKIKKAFSGISTKDLKKNIKELNNNIKHEYNQFGGLINLYILRELEIIHNIINANLNEDIRVTNLFEYLNKEIKDKSDSSSGDEIGYNKIVKRKLLWLLDDLNELEVKNLDIKDPKKDLDNQKLRNYIKDIYNFLTNEDIKEKIKLKLEDLVYKENKEFEENINYLIIKFNYFNDYINAKDDQEKSELVDIIAKIKKNNLLLPNKRKFNLIASTRFNKFFKYTNDGATDNSNRASAEKYAEEDDKKDTILETKVFTDDENNYFKKTISDIIDFAKKKLSSEDRKDKDKIINMLEKIKSIDHKMNTIFKENVDMIRKEFKKNDYDDPDRQFKNKKSRNTFITNLVKLQNNLFQFQIRIIFTQITQINNIINRRLIIIEDDKNKFIDKINNLLDIVNQKVAVMNEYLEATTDEDKNIIPLTNEYKFNEYEYIIDPDTKKKEIIQRQKEVSVDKLSEPTRSVLKEIKDNNNDPSYIYNTRFPKKIRKRLVNETDDPNYDNDEDASKKDKINNQNDLKLYYYDSQKTELDNMIITRKDDINDIVNDKIDFKILNEYDQGILPIRLNKKYSRQQIDDEIQTIDKNITALTTKLTALGQPTTPADSASADEIKNKIKKLEESKLIKEARKIELDKLQQLGGTAIKTKQELLKETSNELSNIADNEETKYINQYIITNFYFIHKICLYIFNNDIIKKLMLLFLTPEELIKQLRNSFNINYENIFKFINCFFIKIISINPNIDILSIDNINQYIKHDKYFKQINYLYQYLKSEYLYSNTLIYYNLINEYTTNNDIPQNLKDKYRPSFTKIIKLRNIFYFIPYLLINIKTTLYDNNSLNNNKYLKLILIQYLNEIYYKLMLLYELIEQIQLTNDANNKLLNIIINDYKIPLLVNLVKNVSVNDTVKPIYNDEIEITSKYNNNGQKIIKGYSAQKLTFDELRVITRYELKNPKIIVQSPVINPSTNKINEIVVTYINYDDRLYTYDLPSTKTNPPDTANYVMQDFRTKLQHITLNRDFSAIDDKLDINKYSFGTFNNIYELNENDVLKKSGNGYDKNVRDIRDLQELHNTRDNIILIGLGISGSGKTTYLIGSDKMHGILIRYNSYMIDEGYKIEIRGIEIKSTYNGTKAEDDLKSTPIEIENNTDPKIQAILDLLEKDRHVAVTPNNKDSSRSQMILLIKYHSNTDQGKRDKFITLCDLAGNEIVFNNQLIYHIKNTYNKIYEKNSGKEEVDFEMEQNKFDNIYQIQIQSNTSKNKLLIEIIKYINDIYKIIKRNNDNHNISDNTFEKEYSTLDFTDNDEENKKIIDEIIKNIKKELDKCSKIFVNRDVKLKNFADLGDSHYYALNLKKIYSCIKDLIEHMFIKQELYSFNEFKSELLDIIEMLFKLKKISMSGVNDIPQVQNDIINAYKSIYIDNKSEDEKVENQIIDNPQQINIQQLNLKITPSVAKQLIYVIIHILKLCTDQNSMTYVMNDSADHDKIFALLRNLKITNEMESIFYFYFHDRYYTKTNFKPNNSTYVTLESGLANANLQFIPEIHFNFAEFIEYNLSIYMYIYITINILSYNLLLRKYEGVFINKFINDFKNDCSKLLKYQNVFNYNKIKHDLSCQLSHITISPFLNINERNNNICLLPTTNLYLDDCNKNNSIYTEINHNVIQNFSSYECDVFKYFYFDNGENRIHIKTNDPESENSNKKLSELKKKLYNDKSVILIETVINLFDWPQFNEFSAPYININKIKLLYKVIKLFDDNKLILEYKSKQLYEKIKKILLNNIEKLKKILNNFKAYKGSDIFNNISKIENILSKFKIDESSDDMLKLNASMNMNDVNQYLYLIIIEINQMNNLTIINSIDTKNILENNDLNTVCNYKAYDSSELAKNTFDPFEVINTIEDPSSHDIQTDEILKALQGANTATLSAYIDNLFQNYNNKKSGSFNIDGKTADELSNEDNFIPSFSNEFKDQYPN